jgi:hypothetical protein
MKATMFPDVTTSRCVCEESSIEVIGLSNVNFLVILRVRRSHHLIARVRASATQKNREAGNDSLDNPVFATTHTNILVKPQNTLNCAIVR